MQWNRQDRLAVLKLFYFIYIFVVNNIQMKAFVSFKILLVQKWCII